MRYTGRAMRTAVVLGLALALAGVETLRAAEDASPCRADLARLCKGVEPGGGRLRACLRAHRTALSPACRAHVESVVRSLRQAGGPDILLACKADLEKLCRGVPAGDGRLRRCLGEHVPRLAEPCRRLIGLATP